ncbi:hypothetical protein AK830_g2518 [Neonectria ditissima]|uniref:Uncharacterized protein n=1 Tax=Neonectria ditissima TaxID=78410 RepID=A0A0P7BJZ3_9HYPO|nr:hypothetical protein AK830_g2518 [Neonectria ditissima]
MGGKVWSEEEERAFWEIIIPQSCVAAKTSARSMDWGQCATLMQDIMGEEARREYSYTSLYEHHYQSVNFGPKSHTARKLLERYLREVEWYKENTAPCPATPPDQENANSQENEDLLEIILAKDPAAKTFLQNKSLDQARGRCRDILPIPAAFGGYAVNGGIGNQLNPSGNSLPSASPPAVRSHTSKLRPLAPKDPVRIEPAPQRQYHHGQTPSVFNPPVSADSVHHNGYCNTGPDSSNIDPALMAGMETTHSVSHPQNGYHREQDMSNIDPALMAGTEMNHSVSRGQKGHHCAGQDISNIDPALMAGGEANHSVSASQHGYHRVMQDVSNIDPALSGTCVAHPNPRHDVMPGYSRSHSSTSSAAGSAGSEGTAVRRRYRTLAPAPAPGAALGVGGAMSQEAQKAQAELDRTSRKRQFGFDHDGPESPPKRPTLDVHYEGYQTYEPEPQPQYQQQTHWQRMGFRDEHNRQVSTYVHADDGQYQRIRVRHDSQAHPADANPPQYTGIPSHEAPEVHRVARQLSQPRYRPLAPAPPRTQDSDTVSQSDEHTGQYRRLRPRPRKAPALNNLI